MSRPANPSWTVEQWAPDTNYPAGAMPWSGTPTKVAWAGAPSAGISPKMGFPAQAFNYVINKLAAQDTAAKTFCQALLDYVGQIPALNFATRSTGIGALTGAAFDPQYRVWYAVGATQNVRSSIDQGLTWSAASDIAAVAGGEDCYGLDVDPSGNVVVAAGIGQIFEKTANTGAWTKRAHNLGLSSPGPVVVAYDPIRARWCVVALGTLTAGPCASSTSTNRTSWSASGTPPTMAPAQHLAMTANKTTGRIVLVAHHVANATIFVRTSDDGGVTWTARASLTTLTANISRVALVRDPSVAGRWLCIVARSTGAYQSEVWASTDDGATFARICSLGASALYNCAPFGSMLVGVTYSPALAQAELVYSLDGGATWYPTGQGATGNVRGVFACDGGVALVTTDAVVVSARAGKPGYAALT